MGVGAKGRPTAKSLDCYAASIVETVREPLIVLDASLRIRSVNRSFCQTFHLVREESEGMELYQLGEREWDIPELRDLLEQTLSQQREVRDFEVDRRFPTIGHRTMLLNARRLSERGDQPPLILLAMEDITHRKRAEETHQLFLAATSHDVLNALNNIVGFAELLDEGRSAQAVAPHIISLSKTVGEIMRNLVDHAHAENDHLDFALVSARAVIRERTEAIEWQCKQKGLGLRVELPEEGSITTDPVKVTRILDNVLSNAVRYTPSGTVHLRSELAPTSLTVTVQDTGIGIHPEHLGRVFEHYYRAPTAQRIAPLGAGLGLSMVKRLCDLLGGTTKIESTPDVGTTCLVVLPRHPAAAACGGLNA